MARTRSVAAKSSRVISNVTRSSSRRGSKGQIVKNSRPDLVSGSSVSGSSSAASSTQKLDGLTNINQKVVAKTSSRKSKPHIETYYSHIEIPPDLSLPVSFVESHTPEFIVGVKGILNIDPSLYPVIVHENFDIFSGIGPVLSGPDLINDYWYSLIKSILGQQISGHAAKAIRGRFELLFEGVPTPEKTLQLDPQTVKAVGLSNMKLNYVMHISETFAKGDSKLSDPAFYDTATTDELIKELTVLKGVGEWSARMFCLFTLRNMDIFAFDDLGVARGVARYLEVRPDVLAEAKEGVHAVEELKVRLKRKGKFASANSKRDWTPLHDEYVKFLAQKFRPYQLIFMLLMWRLSATSTEVLLK